MSCEAALIDLTAVARKAVKGGANCLVVRGVHRNEAQTLDGLRSAGYVRLGLAVPSCNPVLDGALSLSRTQHEFLLETELSESVRSSDSLE